MIHFQTTPDPSQFLQVIYPALERDEAANQLMLGVAGQVLAQTSQTYSPTPPFLGWVEDEHGLIAAGLMTPPYPLILYCEPALQQPALEKMLAGIRLCQVPGVIGKNHIVEAFASLWQQQTGAIPQVTRRERVFKCTQVTWLPELTGKLRQAQPKDFDLVLEWAKAFDNEEMQDEDGPAVEPNTRRQIAGGELYLWDDGIPTAMALVTWPTHHGCSLTSVYTPPSLRGRGYASALVGNLSQLLLTNGCSYTHLMTNLANPISNHIYPKLGYRPVCDYETIRWE
jgi:predicted GNAT family acetyltransferase